MEGSKRQPKLLKARLRNQRQSRFRLHIDAAIMHQAGDDLHDNVTVKLV